MTLDLSQSHVVETVDLGPSPTVGAPGVWSSPLDSGDIAVPSADAGFGQAAPGFGGFGGFGASGGGGADFQASLQPASWRGLSFGVVNENLRAGRSVAEHVYPYRETRPEWVEDTGRMPRRFSFIGFLVGGDVVQQRINMLRAAEQAGPGTLVHPTLGTLQVSLVSFSCGMQSETGRVSDLSFEFVEAGEQLYPTSFADTGSAVDDAADEADGAADGGLLSGLQGAFSSARNAVAGAVGAVSNSISNTFAGVTDFIDRTGLPQAVTDATAIGHVAMALTHDAAGVVNSVRGVVGAFGRFDGVGSISNPASGISGRLSTVQQALAQGVAARAVVANAANNLSRLVISL